MINTTASITKKHLDGFSISTADIILNVASIAMRLSFLLPIFYGWSTCWLNNMAKRKILFSNFLAISPTITDKPEKIQK
ncbi:MAG: hypothetical protein A2X81_15730 [Desulfobacterales bacterium GWB2_56_26]|nr:MAG: hypothetical protein A2X81_15730 [Desulfobacterales bacterium GWB2_56_26]